MKRFNLLIIFALIFLCAGCKADYNINIDKDLKVKETTRATEDNSFFGEYEKSSVGRVIGFILEPYLETLNENNYVTESYVGSKSGGAIFTKEFSSLEDYVNNNLMASQYTDKINYSKKGNKITLTAKGEFSKAEQDQTRFPIDTANVSITLPFDVTEHNADIVDGDTYTWKFKKTDTERDIKITFDSSKIVKDINYGPIIIIIVIVILLIGGYLMYNNINQKRKEENKI